MLIVKQLIRNLDKKILLLLFNCIMSDIPAIIFIVPYRNRPQHKFFFSNYLTTIMQGRDDYEIYFAHQCDARSFNRGATKNIGFLAAKNKYPNDYKNITFVFNDIDTIPFSTIFDFETTAGVVKHFYGFKYALGGIVSLKGVDFEAINGYPGFWGWGMEDNVLQKRCESHGLIINRNQFYPIGSPEILHLFDGVSRIINSKDPWRATNDDGLDGLKTIRNLNYSIKFESNNPLDNIHIVDSNKVFMINITTFMTHVRFEHDNYYKYDIREPPRKIIHPNRIKTNKIEFLTDDWSNIPFYPSAEKKHEMIKQYGQQTAEQIIQYSYENSIDPTMPIIPPQLQQTHHQQQQQQQQQSISLSEIQLYNQQMRQLNSKARIVPPNINKFSPEYAKIIATKPKASKSVNIGLGGVY